jgi:hypothetical protein
MADDGIDGNPGVMESVDIAGPTGTYKQWTVNSIKPIVSDMMEGQAFADVDLQASKDLANFVRDMDRGFEAYTNTAKNAGHDYLASDQAGADALQAITRQQV